MAQMIIMLYERTSSPMVLALIFQCMIRPAGRLSGGDTLWIMGLSCMAALLLLLYLRTRKQLRDARKSVAEHGSNEAKYRRLIEGAGAVMYTTNRGGYFTYLSPQVESFTGYQPDELSGKSYTVLIDPAHLDEIRNFYELQVLQGPDETTRELTILRKNGDIRWVEQQVVILRENGKFQGYQCLVKDIHQKKMIQLQLEQTEQEMRQVHYRLESILENTPTVIFIKDLEGRYLLVNKRFEELLGVPSAQIIGKKDQDFPETFKSGQDVESDREVLQQGHQVNIEEKVETEQATRYFLITKFPLRDHMQQIYGLCGIATDITDRIRYEHGIIDARQKAEKAKRLQEIFMANISHEIRTPLNGIIGMTNYLRTLPAYPAYREPIDDIAESANQLLVLVDSLLDFSELKAGKAHLKRTDFDPRFLVKKSLAMAHSKAEAKGLTLQYELSPDIPDHILGDPVRLQQVLDHLIDNAIRFTEEGSIRLKVKVTDMHDMHLSLSFELQDTGIGIPTEKLQELQEGFLQAEGDSDRRHGGAGLGLALAKQLIHLQQGQMTLESKAGEGTLIRFSIPFHRNLFSQKTTEEQDLPSLHGKTILIAEDNPINQKVAARTLEQAGAAWEIAVNGFEVLKKIKEKKFDCILMDIQMPEMDGLKATRLIRQEGSPVPVIAMTASALKGDREKCLLAGMNDYISKPFIPDDLYHAILRALGEYAQEPLPPSGTRPFVDLHYLRSVSENDPQYLRDALHTFIENASDVFDHLMHSAMQQSWDEVYQYANLLLNSLNVVRILELSIVIQRVSHHARNRIHTDKIMEDLLLAISIYKDAQQVLQKEII